MSLLSKNPRDIHDAKKEAVVDSLLNGLSARVAGRDEFSKIVYGMKPSAALVSEFIVPMPVEQRDQDEEADPIRICAHGLDFQINASAMEQHVNVDVAGAVYVRVLPSEEEVKPGGLLEATFPLTREARQELRNRVNAALKTLTEGMPNGRKNPEWAQKSLEARKLVYASMHVPFDNGLDRSPPPEEGEGTKEAADGNNQDEVEDGVPIQEVRVESVLSDSLAESIAPPPKWYRIDLKLPSFEFRPSTAEADAKAASELLNLAIEKQLAAWAEDATEPFGGKLWGYRRGLPIRPSHVRDWKAYLAAVRASSVKVLVPTLSLKWVAHCVSDPIHNDRITVHLALENWTEPLNKNNHKELEPALFQCSVTATISESAHRWLHLDRVKPSYRYNKFLKYPALGFNGGVVFGTNEGRPVLKTTWAPRYVLPRIIPTDGNVVRDIAKLAQPDCIAGLDPLIEDYERWLEAVARIPIDEGIDGPDATEARGREAQKLRRDLESWKSELSSIRTGIEILRKSRAKWSGPGMQKDPLGIPFEAWVAMNAAMAKVAADKGYSEWRLFQLAFILSSIPAFATRIPAFHEFYDAATAEQSDAVTLLYFATGGGKSEAFLGLLVYVLFLDRLRGKSRGVSSLMRYPLRLLTLQQARRTFVSMCAAEDQRVIRGISGEPFSLGFWVGGANTPNWHSDDGYNDVPTDAASPISKEAGQLKDSAYKAARERWMKLTTCPFCRGDIALRRQSAKGGNLLGHFCTSPASKCSWNRRHDASIPLPFYIVDEDIYDLAPSVLLGTVDKLAAIGQSQGTIRKFFGMFGFAPLMEKDTGRLFIPMRVKEWEGHPGSLSRPLHPSYKGGDRLFFDPFPSLLIQDEAHLLDESLGTFAGLFESALEAAFDRLSPRLRPDVSCEPKSSTRRKIKVIAASATVTDPQRQMRNLYQRHTTVQFPHPGPDLYRSFYAEPKQPDATANDLERLGISVDKVEVRSHWARVYASILTNGHRHTVAMASILASYHLMITGLYERLRSGDIEKQNAAKSELIRWLSHGPLYIQFRRVIEESDFETLLTLIDLHRISLTYVTNKKGGDQVIDTEKVQFEKLHKADGYDAHYLSSELISGAVSAGDIQSIVRRAEARVKMGQPFPDLNDTLRSVIATSAISHGVDVEEFNAMFFAGMPSDIAEYIQASSRVGRTHIGFSILVPIPQRHRDRFVTEIHDIFHRFLERMILPAAVDRWAEKALVRVMPSFFQEFICGMNAVEMLCSAEDDEKKSSPTYAMAAEVRDFLENPANLRETEAFMEKALGLDFLPSPEGKAYYKALLKKEIALYQKDLAVDRYVNATRLAKFFEARNSLLRPMTSLRDVDQPGLIHESRRDASFKTVGDDVTARAMLFIRRGSGADVDSTDIRTESRE